MDSVTIGQIGIALTFIVGLISSAAYLKKHLHDWISQSMQPQFEEINKKLKDMEAQIDEVDINACKNFLVRVLSNIEAGQQIDDVQLMRFWERYEHYLKAGGNSYIREKVEKLKLSGKL